MPLGRDTGCLSQVPVPIYPRNYDKANVVSHRVNLYLSTFQYNYTHLMNLQDAHALTSILEIPAITPGKTSFTSLKDNVGGCEALEPEIAFPACKITIR